jgi:methionine-gamma-lyase
MSTNKKINFDSMCVHSGIGEYEHRPVTPPIYQTSTFKFDNADQGAALFKGEIDGYIYTRMLNPTIQAMENAVAELEGGHKALGCASGMAAISTVFMSFLKAGDHVVCSNSVYGPTLTLLKNVMSKFNVETTAIDTDKEGEIERAIKPNTKIVYIETPANPMISITDLEKAAALAHKNSALLVVDNTFMSPALQQPFNFGADVVLHSMTKYLNGHADVVGGVVVVKDETTYLAMRKILNQHGGVIDPFNAFLVHRGLKTLAIRMKKHCENTKVVAEFLVKHPKIKYVKYPGLKDHHNYEIGLKQHKDFGGMLSFELNGGFSAGKTLMDNVKFCTLAVSLGGVETLIQHPASMTHLTMGAEARKEAGITEGLVRLSVGIENVNDIIDDLEQALSKIA